MPKNNSNQCPNCCRWFNNSRSLKLHITSCQKKHFGDGGLTKNDDSSPLKLAERNTDLNKYVHEETNDIHVNTDNFHCGNFSNKKRLNLHTSDNMLLGTSSYYTDDNISSEETTDHCYHLGNRTTAITKLQVKLNDIINNHKASLKMHDDLVNIFNEYISSPNIDRYAKLKSQKSFIQSMETELNVSHLRPKQMKVGLHDGSEQIVPVFDAKAMILDILTKNTCMQQQNIAQGYDVL